MSINIEALIPRILAIAKEASTAINDIHQKKSYQVKSKLDHSPITEADLLANHIIEQGLLAIDPLLPMISEEGAIPSFDVRSKYAQYWLVDPLDGTREFIRGTEEFTVNIALIVDHLPVLGVIAVPKRHEYYWGVRGAPAAYRQKRGEAPELIHTALFKHSPTRILASHRFNAEAKESLALLLKNQGNYELSYYGSSYKICLIAEGKGDLYPQMDKTCEWDTAAGQCILEAAGGQLLDFKGNSLRYNTKPSLENPPFYAFGDSKLALIYCG